MRVMQRSALLLRGGSEFDEFFGFVVGEANRPADGDDVHFSSTENSWSAQAVSADDAGGELEVSTRARGAGLRLVKTVCTLGCELAVVVLGHVLPPRLD